MIFEVDEILSLEDAPFFKDCSSQDAGYGLRSLRGPVRARLLLGTRSLLILDDRSGERGTEPDIFGRQRMGYAKRGFRNIALLRTSRRDL